MAKEFTSEQEFIHDRIVKDRFSVFFTGPGGTGKSFLLEEIVKSLKRSRRIVAVTASTGKAALNIGGCTLHSFAGIGLGRGTKEELLASVRKHKTAKDRWKVTDVLIIDEISMINGDLLDSLEFIARKIRNNDIPFGGIQLVLVGDNLQLPPVKSSKFVFEADCWKDVVEETLQLTKIFRQEDEEFIKMLNEVREGRVSDETETKLKALSREPVYPNDGISATHLYPLRSQVDEENQRRLDELPGKEYQYIAFDYGSAANKNKLAKDCMAPSVLCLKENAQVMLIKNFSETLVNGSLGVIVGFDANDYPMVKFDTGETLVMERMDWVIEDSEKKVIARRRQVPLILAYAITIHKSQSTTISRLKVDLGRSFGCGMAYVALSRARSMDGLQVLNFDKSCCIADQKALLFHKGL